MPAVSVSELLLLNFDECVTVVLWLLFYITVHASRGIQLSLENGRLSDWNRIAADTCVSNRIEIGRNK